ncbi:MAG: helix-turn-helix transcriptional regulator [Clostridia bacterium]|nr:helix-turn-helix transcriptional regulator [Clostridia bacterium]
MDELSQLIKKNIKLKYSSTRRFSEELGIPQTTIVSAIKNGISGTSFTTVCKICRTLDIKLIDGIYPVVMSDNTRNMLKKLSQLDDKGIHTVSTVLEMEYNRCKNNEDSVINSDDIPTKYELSGFVKATDD